MRIAPLVLVLLVAACAPKPTPAPAATAMTPAPAATAAAAPTPAREYFRGMAGATGLCQLYVDGWDALTPKERLYAYYLSQATLAGRDIYWKQMHRDGLAVRALMEGILASPGTADPKTVAKIRGWMREVWVDNAFYDSYSSKKISPSFGPSDLAAAASAALETGVNLGAPGEAPVTNDRQLLPLLNRLEKVLFDPNTDPVLTARAPAGGKDIVQLSAVNFYSGGVTLAEVEKLKAKYPLNANVTKKKGTVVEQVWRAGDGKVPPGMYATELTAVTGWLEKALTVSPAPEEKKVVEALVRYYKTGEYEDFRTYAIAWLGSKTTVDFIQGFHEVYDDPRGEKGSWEGMVLVRDPVLSTRMETLAAHAARLEKAMPWKDEYKRPDVKPAVAQAVQVVFTAGDSGPRSPLGVNLPNPQDIRQTHGSKSSMLSNVAACVDEVIVARSTQEFALPEDRAEILRYGPRAQEAKVALHEVAGHASGRASAKLEGDPSKHIKEYYSTLEEARADLVALWHVGDAELIKAGVVQASQTQGALYRLYTMDVLAQLRRAPTGDKLHQDHLRGRQMVVNFAREKGAVETIVRDGKTYFHVTSPEKFHAAAGELLAELQRIKSEGDYKAAKALIEKHGVRFDPKLRDEVIARAKAAGVPVSFAFMNPRLVPVIGAKGEVVDATLSYADSWEEQMLRYGGQGAKKKE